MKAEKYTWMKVVALEIAAALYNTMGAYAILIQIKGNNTAFPANF
jgi:hypothetical protein